MNRFFGIRRPRSAIPQPHSLVGFAEWGLWFSAGGTAGGRYSAAVLLLVPIRHDLHPCFRFQNIPQRQKCQNPPGFPLKSGGSIKVNVAFHPKENHVLRRPGMRLSEKISADSRHRKRIQLRLGRGMAAYALTFAKNGRARTIAARETTSGWFSTTLATPQQPSHRTSTAT